MSDTVIRALRTAIQAFAGFAASGALVTIWNSYIAENDVDPTVMVAMGLVLTYVASWANNAFEDKTGKRILGMPVPKDRKTGDATLGTGIGSKSA